MKRERLFYCLVFLIIEAVFLLTAMRAKQEEVSLWQIVDCVSFYDVRLSASYIANFFFDMFPYIFFQLIWGTYLYEKFCTASVYFFSRNDNKGKWYFRECIKLYLCGIVYLIGFLLAGGIYVASGTKIIWDSASFYILFLYLLLYSFFLFTTTMLINLLSIWIKSIYGFSLVVSVELLAIALYGVLGKFVELSEEGDNELGKKIIALKCDPISHLVLRWHSSFLEKADKMINHYRLSFLIEESVLVWAVAAFAVLLLGFLVIKRTELIENEKE